MHRTTARVVKRCSLTPTEIPLFPASSRTGNTSDPGGEIPRVVERSMINWPCAGCNSKLKLSDKLQFVVQDGKHSTLKVSGISREFNTEPSTTN
jgi:hypothetical protein